MKKIIVTLCSIALSIAGTFGVNELSTQNGNAIDTYSNVNNEQKNDGDVYVQSDVMAKVEKPADNTIQDKEAPTEDKEMDDVVTKKPQTKSKEAIEKDEAVEVASAKNNDYKNNQIEAPKTKNVTEKLASKETPISNNVDGKNQIYVYKNVDLSDCSDAQDVVKKLQSYGFDNINMNNVNQITSLDGIMDKINSSSNNGSTGGTGSTTTPKPSTPATTTPKPSTPATTTPKPSTPTTTPKPESTTKPSNNTNSYADQVLQLVNQERAKAGLSALTTNATLAAAANHRAKETVQSFSHTRPNGSSFSTVFGEYGISYMRSGENIAYGQKTPQEVVTGWMNSPGHRANIMNGSFNKIGIGVYQQNGVIYWSQLFTN